MHITKRELRKLINEALEVILTNSEAIEMFGDEIAPKLAESDDAVSAEISKLVKKGKSQKQAVAMALSMDEEGKLDEEEQLDEHDMDPAIDMDLGDSEILQKLQQIVDGIGETNRRLEDIDTSVDYAAAGILGDDPDAIQLTQKLGGRIGHGLTKEALQELVKSVLKEEWVLRWSGHGQEFLNRDGEYGSRSDAETFASEEEALEKAKYVEEHGDGYHLVPEPVDTEDAPWQLPRLKQDPLGRGRKTSDLRKIAMDTNPYRKK